MGVGRRFVLLLPLLSLMAVPLHADEQHPPSQPPAVSETPAPAANDAVPTPANPKEAPPPSVKEMAAPPAKEASPPPAKEAAPPAAKEPAPPPSVTIIGAQDAHGVLGRDVRSSTDQDMGHIVDVIVDRSGMVRAAVIDFGGFLGVGTRKIAVDWRALRFAADGGKERKLSVALTRNQVRVSPEYKAGEPIVVLGPASPAAPGSEGEQAATAAAPAAQPAPAAVSPPATPATTPASPAVAPQPAPTGAAPTTAASPPEKAPDK